MSAETEKFLVLIHGVLPETFFEALARQACKDVVVLEGRPGLDAAKDSCRKLQRRGFVPTLMADNMAGYLFYKNQLKEVWLSYQAADKKGAMCDIGALIVAVLARKHSVPVFGYPSARKRQLLGKPKDVLQFNGQPITKGKIKAYVPLVEWVPAKYFKDIYE